jgi:hypothetical protein
MYILIKIWVSNTIRPAGHIATYRASRVDSIRQLLYHVSLRYGDIHYSIGSLISVPQQPIYLS